jgi:mono/diheme cytochrome c family protein
VTAVPAILQLTRRIGNAVGRPFQAVDDGLERPSYKIVRLIGASPSRRCARLVLLAAVALAGCWRSAPPEFPLNLEGRPPQSVSAPQAAAIRDTLAQFFGTPNEPLAPQNVRLDPVLLAAAAGPVAGDAQGRQRGLFRRHCVTCHGLAGDGAGPTAFMLDPYPRDFRSGTFKYTSTRAGAKPVRHDLQRTLSCGIPGTAMPSFADLRCEETEALIEYVQYLSIRGETELYLLQLVVDDRSNLPPDMELIADEGVRPAADSWLLPEARAGELVVIPPQQTEKGDKSNFGAIRSSKTGDHNPKLDLSPFSELRAPAETEDALAASIAKGKQLYLAKSSQCAKCHGPGGDGNGEERELYDDWNKRKRGATPEQTAEMAAWFKLPIVRLRPRNFHEGVFHGGSGAADVYTRICVGIKGTPMPAAGSGPGSEGALKPNEIWNVVDFVRSLGTE